MIYCYFPHFNTLFISDFHNYYNWQRMALTVLQNSQRITILMFFFTLLIVIILLTIRIIKKKIDLDPPQPEPESAGPQYQEA